MGDNFPYFLHAGFPAHQAQSEKGSTIKKLLKENKVLKPFSEGGKKQFSSHKSVIVLVEIGI